jgi:hypothetical protein
VSGRISPQKGWSSPYLVSRLYVILCGLTASGPSRRILSCS